MAALAAAGGAGGGESADGAPPPAETLARVLARIAAATPAGQPVPRLVAVSKTKPLAAVAALYEAGARHFGENYVAELVGKAGAVARGEAGPAAATVEGGIAWHFIGHLQSNKAKALVAGVPGLWAVESVDSVKLATTLNRAVEGAWPAGATLRVFVQVNTSDEAQKGGTAPGAATVALARHITTACPRLRLTGLMTIGKAEAPADVYFERLAAEREGVAAALALPPASLELSMGMSADFESAVAHGATNVRIGSTLFGARVYPGAAAAAAASAAAEADADAKPVGAATSDDDAR